MSKTLWYFCLLSLLSCAQVTSLNLKKHQFGKIPTKIIWLQVAGLSSEHLAMLRFSYPKGDQKTAFENSLCIGSAWNYNLYKIRPSAREGFLSQLTGKKNIKNECSDYKQKPIWKYIANKGYRVGVIEGEMRARQSLLDANKCEENSFIKEIALWKMEKGPKDSQLFHLNEKKIYEPGVVYYDKSCSSGNCFTNASKNIEGIFSKYTKTSKNYLFIIRNFNYLNSLRKKNLKRAQAELNELNLTIKYFQKIIEKDPNALLLISAAEPVDLEFPTSGKQWKQYEKGRRKLKINNTKLLSPVYASGARAENFCGIYEQDQILSRIFSGAKQQNLEFSIINPFE